MHFFYIFIAGSWWCNGRQIYAWQMMEDIFLNFEKNVRNQFSLTEEKETKFGFSMDSYNPFSFSFIRNTITHYL